MGTKINVIFMIFIAISAFVGIGLGMAAFFIPTLYPAFMLMVMTNHFVVMCFIFTSTVSTITEEK